ncbi:hypothetical protein GJ496_002010 [Pomphorhynchus laevis]|nr:hypothetical protein GJ496_002010 [Pomphorhynchus laevis]
MSSTVKSDHPPTLPINHIVTAKFRGASCEAKIIAVLENVQIQIKLLEQYHGSIVTVPKYAIVGSLQVGETVSVKKLSNSEQTGIGIVQAIKDESQYTIEFNDGDKLVVRRRSLRLNDNMNSVNKQEKNRPIHRGYSRHKRITNLKASNTVEQQSLRKGNIQDVIIAAVDESLPKELEDTSQEDNCGTFIKGMVVLAKDNTGFFPALITEKPNSENITVRNFINDSTITVKVNDISILDESKINQMKMLLPGLDMSKVEEYMRNPHYYSNWTPPCDTEINILSSEDECLQEKDYFLANLLNFLEASGITFVKSPLVNGVSCDLCILYRLVNKNGGWSKVCKKHLWGDIHRAMCLPTSGDEECGIELEKIYHKYLRAFYDMNRKLGSPTVASHKGVKRSVSAVTRVSQRLFKPSSSDLRGSRCVEQSSDSLPPLAGKLSHIGSKRKINTCIHSSGERQSIQSASDEKTCDLRTTRLRALITRRKLKAQKNSKYPTDFDRHRKTNLFARESNKLSSQQRSSHNQVDSETNGHQNSRKGRNKVSVNHISPLPILQHKTRRNASRSHSPTNKQARIFNITPDNNLQCSKSIATKFTINQIGVHSFVKVLWSTLDAERSVYVAKVIDKILEKSLVYVHYVGWNSRHDQWVSLDKIVDIDCSPPAPGTRQSKPKIVRQQSGEASSVSNTDLLSAAKTDETEAYSAAQISRRTHLSSSHSSIECIGLTSMTLIILAMVTSMNMMIGVQFDHGSDDIGETIREIRIEGIQPGYISSEGNSTIADGLKHNLSSYEDEIVDFVNNKEIDEFDVHLNFQDVQSVESDLPEYLKISRHELVDALHLPRSFFNESSTIAEMINCLSPNFYDYDSTTTNISQQMSFSPTSSNQNKRNNAANDLNRALIAIGTGNDNANILLRHELINTPIMDIEERSTNGSNLAGSAFNVTENNNTADNPSNDTARSHLFSTMDNLASSLIRIESMFRIVHEEQERNQSINSELTSSDQLHLHFSEFRSKLASKQGIPFVYSICVIALC